MDKNSWIASAIQYGFTVTPTNKNYVVTDNITQELVGELAFNENNWSLTEPRKPTALTFEEPAEAIEYLAAVVSFGNQLA